MRVLNTNEIEYRGYFILDGTGHDYLTEPGVFVFRSDEDAYVLKRVFTVADAMAFIDSLIHEQEFNQKFKEFIDDV